MKIIVIDGKEFIKASEAAKKHGYTNDYIGQLCRSNKVEAKLVGRTWYVNPDSLLEHRRGRYRSSHKKTKEELEKTVKQAFTEEVEQPAPRFYKRLTTNTKVLYSEDEEELIPTPKKIIVETEGVIGNKPNSLEVKNNQDEDSLTYGLDQISEDRPRRGVLKIIEDTSETPSLSPKENKVPVTIKKEVPLNNRNNIRKLSAKDSKIILNKTTRSQTKPLVRDSQYSPESSVVGYMVPISVSLLAGLAVTMLLYGLSWQFESNGDSYSESYRVNVSSVIQK